MISYNNCVSLFSVTIFPSSVSSLREIEFLSSLFQDRYGNAIPSEILNGVLDRRMDKINELKENGNLTSEELVFCDFAIHSLEFMQVLLKSSQETEHLAHDILIKSYMDIVQSFHSLFNDTKVPSIEYESVESLNKVMNEYSNLTNYPMEKMKMLIKDYKSDFNLLIDYRMDEKRNSALLIDALETLQCEIVATAESDDKLKGFKRRSAKQETMRIAWQRFELIVKVFKKRFIN